MATVHLRSLTKTFPPTGRTPAFAAVRGIDLEVRDGEFMVLVGPSGCGKSTTLRMIAGLEDITAGSIEIGGRVVNDVLPKDRDIAMVFQNYALYPHMTVRENLAFGLRLRKLPGGEITRRVDQAAELLGLGGLLDRRPRELSGGQRQRVAVGRAIVRQPQVFLFDEPLSNLDAKMRAAMRGELARLHQRLGATMIYVTHDQVEAMTMGDRICVMNDGVIQQLAAPLDLYLHPRSLFVGGFIGSPPMNCLRVALDQTDGSWRLRSTDDPDAPPLRLPEGCRPAGDLVGRALVLGFRAEDVVPGQADAPLSLTGRVELKEALGADTLVHVRAGSTTFTVRVRSDLPVRVGDVRAWTLAPERIRFFAADSGVAVGVDGALARPS